MRRTDQVAARKFTLMAKIGKSFLGRGLVDPYVINFERGG